MDDCRQKPVAGQTQSIFVLKVMQAANPCYEYEQEPEEVAHIVGYFSSLDKALEANKYYKGDFGWHYVVIEEAFMDPPPIQKGERQWLPLTVSGTKETKEEFTGPRIPDWQFVPEESTYAKYRSKPYTQVKSQERIIEELRAEIVRLQDGRQTKAPDEEVRPYRVFAQMKVF